MLEDPIKNNIIAILTYCNTEEKINVLIENIKIIRENYSEFKIAVHANYPLPEYIQKMVDIYFYEDLNVISPKYSRVWRSLPYFDKKFIFHFYEEYGYSVLQMIKSLSKYLKEYKKILLINYDLVIEKEYIDNHLKLDYDLIIYGRESGCYLTIMSFDPLIFSEKISILFNYKSYLELNKIPESVFYHYVENSGIKYVQIDYDVKDTISNMPYAAFKNDYFNENLVCFNNNKLEIYLWYLSKKIDTIKIKIDEHEFLLINQNTKGAFEAVLDYEKEILNINIVQMNDINTNIQLNIVKNSMTEKI